MSNRTLNITDELYEYILAVGVRESDVAAELRQKTRSLAFAQMQISPEQGAFMGLLIRLLGVKRAIEIGTFTGYSALVVAEALPHDGSLTTCDVSKEWTEIGLKFWAKAGVDHKIDLRLQPALQTLDELIASGLTNSFDFAFIDADKTNYNNYYERILNLLRPGGLVAIDNTLWGGAVVDESRQDENTAAIRALNLKVREDVRVDAMLLPIGDGLTLALKR